MPGVVWRQPANVATPATAALDRPPVHENVPPFWLIAIATVRVSVVTVLPPSSTMATDGWGANVAGVGLAGYVRYTR